MTHKNQCVGTTHEGVDEMLTMQSKLRSMEQLVSDLRTEKFLSTRKDAERETQLLVVTGQLESRKKAVAYLQRTLFQDLLSLRRHTDGLEALQSNGGGDRSPQFNLGRRRSSHALLSTATVAAMERGGGEGDAQHASFVFGESSPPRVATGVFPSEPKATTSPIPRPMPQSTGGYRSGTGTTSDFTYLDAFRFLEELGIPMNRITEEEGTTSNNPFNYRLLSASTTSRGEQAFNKAPVASGGSAMSGLLEKQLATAIVQRNVLEVAYVEMKRSKERADVEFKERLVVLETEAERRSGSALLEVEEERRKERDTHRAELEAKDKRIADIRKEFNDLSVEHSDSVAKVTELEDIIAAAGSATTAAMADMKRDVAIKATQIKTQTATIEGLEAELDELKVVLEETTTTLQYASEERDALKVKCDDQEAELIPLLLAGAQVIDLKRTNAQLKESVSAGQKQIAELKISIEELGEQLEMRNESLQALDAYRTGQESTNAQAEVALGDAQDQIRQRDDRIAVLEDEVNALKARLAQGGGEVEASPDGGLISIMVDDPVKEDGSVRRKRSARLASIAAPSDPAGATRSLSGLCSSARESSRGDSSASANMADGMDGSTTDAPRNGGRRRKSVKGRRKSTARSTSGAGEKASEKGKPAPLNASGRPTSAIASHSSRPTSARPPIATKNRRGSISLSTAVPMNTFESVGDDLSHSDGDDQPKELLVAQPSTNSHNHNQSLSASVSINPTPTTIGSTTTAHQSTTGILSAHQSGSGSAIRGGTEAAMDGSTTLLPTTTTTPPQPTRIDAASSPMGSMVGIPTTHKRTSLVDSATLVQGDSLVFTSVPPPATHRRSTHSLLSGGDGGPVVPLAHPSIDNYSTQSITPVLDAGGTVDVVVEVGNIETDKVDSSRNSRKSSVADFSSASHNNYNFSMSDEVPVPIIPPPPLEGPSPLFVDSTPLSDVHTHRHVAVQTNLLTMAMLDEAVRVARQMGYNQASIHSRVSTPHNLTKTVPQPEVESVQHNGSLPMGRSVSPPHRHPCPHQVSPFRASPNHQQYDSGVAVANPPVVGLSQAYTHDTSVTFSANTSVATSIPVQYPPAHHTRPHSALATVNRALGTPTTCTLNYRDGTPTTYTSVSMLSEEDVSARISAIQEPLHTARPQSALPMRMAKGGVREMGRKAKELVAAISANGWDGGVTDGGSEPPPKGVYRPAPKAPIEVVYEGPGAHSGATSFLQRPKIGGLGDPTQLRRSQPSTRSAMSRPLLTVRSELSQQTRVPLWDSTATPYDPTRNVLGMTSKEAHAASNGSGCRPTRGKSAGRPCLRKHTANMELGGEDVYMVAHQMQVQHEMYMDAHESEARGAGGRRATAAVVVPARSRRQPTAPITAVTAPKAEKDGTAKRSKKKKQNLFGTRPYLVHCRIPEDLVWGPTGLRRGSCTTSEDDDDDDVSEGVESKELSKIETTNDVTLMDTSSIAQASIPDLVLTSTMAAFTLSQRADPEKEMSSTQGPDSTKKAIKKKKHRQEKESTQRPHDDLVPEGPEDRITVDHVRQMMACFYSTSVDVTTLLEEEVQSLTARSKFEGIKSERGRPFKEEVVGKGGSVWRMDAAASISHNKIRRSVMATAQAQLETHESFLKTHKESEMRTSSFIMKKGDAQQTLPNSRKSFDGGSRPSRDASYQAELNRALSAVQKARKSSSFNRKELEEDGSGAEAGAETTKKSDQATDDEEMFARLSLRKRRRLDVANFVFELSKVIGHLASEDELRGWFNRADVDNTGTVGWDELSAFLLSKGDHRGHMETRPFSLGIQLQPETCHPWNRHEGRITCAATSPKTGRVYTGGEEGMIIAWDENTLRHHGVLYRGTSWIVGIKLSHNYGRLFACTSNRELLIFDLKSGYLMRQYNGRTVFAGEVGASYASESTPMITVGGTKAGHLAAKGERVCTNRADETEKLRRLMAQKGAKGGGVGMTGGLDLTSGRSIAVGASGEKMHADELKRLAEVASDHTKGTDKRRVEQFLLVGLIDIPTSFEYHHSAHGNDIVFFGTRQGQILLYVIPATHEKFVKPLVTLGNVHTAQINDIQILPELECALSCSDDCTLKLISMETGAVTRTYRGHKTGVLGFVFAHKTKLIVSHSSERSALVWDYYQDAPIFTLQEHASPLISICVNEREGHVYTLSNDNAIRISDIVSHKTLQTVQHKRVLPTSAMQASDGAAEIPAFCTMMYDSVRRRHLCCSSFPQMYQLKKAATQFPPSYTGHISPVAALKYNSAFKQLITFDMGLTVIWDPITGSSRFSFPFATNFSSTSSSGAGDGALLDEVRITAVGWDVTQRRLLVGFHNGMMVAWNYANGQALNVVRDSTFDYVNAAATYGTEVTAIAATVMADKATYVYAVGRCLMFVPESQQYTISTTTKWELPDELGGITSLARISSSLFAIGTTSGAVVFYNVSMEQMEGRPLWLSEQAITHGVLLSSQDEPPSPKKDEPSNSLFGASTDGKMTRRGSKLGVSVGGRSRATSRTAFINVDQSNSGSVRRTSSAAPTNASNPSTSITSATNRVEKVFLLGAKGNALLAAHNDGHCGLWHTTKRSFLGGFYVTGGAPVPEDGNKSRVSVGISNFAIEEESCETFAYSDELGNVSVWSLAFEEIPFVECLKRYLKTTTTTGATNALDWHMGSKESVTALSETHTKRRSCFKAHDAGTITGVVLLPALDSGGCVGPPSVFSYSGKGPIVITCSSDCTTKAFTLDGVCIGVFGLKPWSLHKASTWVTATIEPPVEAPAQAGVDLDDTGGQFGPGGNLPSGITFASMMGKLSGSRRRVGAEAGDPDMVDVLIAQESFGINTAEVKRKRAERLKVKEARKKEILRRRRAREGRTGGGSMEDGGEESDTHMGSQSNRSAEEAQALLETLNRIPHVPVFASQSIRVHQPITYLAPAGSVLDEQLQPAHDMPSQQRQRKVFRQYEQQRRVAEARKKRELRAQQRAEDELLDRSGGSRCASNMSSRQSMSSLGSRPNSSHSQAGSPLHVVVSSSDSELDGGMEDIEDTAALTGHGDNYHDRRGLERGGLFRPLRPPNDPRSFPSNTRNNQGTITTVTTAPQEGPLKATESVDITTTKRPSANAVDDAQDDEDTPAAYPIDIHGAYDPVAARRRAILKKSAINQHQEEFDDEADDIRETSHVAEFAFLGASESDVKAVSPRGGSSCRPGYSSIRASPNPIHITPIGDPYAGMAYLEALPQRGGMAITGPSVSLSADRYSPQASPSPNRGTEAPPTTRSPRLRPLRKRAGPTSPSTSGLVPTIEISSSFNTKAVSSLNVGKPSPRTWSALSGISMAVTEDDGMGSRQPSTSMHASSSPPQQQSFPELLASFHLGGELSSDGGGGGGVGGSHSHSSSWTNPVIKIAPTVPVPPPAQSTLLSVDTKSGAVMRRISAVSFKSPSPMVRSRMTTPHQHEGDTPVVAVEPSPVEVAPNAPGSGVDIALQQRLVSFGNFALDGSPPAQHADPPPTTTQQPLPKLVRSPRTSPKSAILSTSPSAGSIDLPPIAIPQSAVEVPLSPRATNYVPPTPHKTDITLRAVEHLREQQDRLEQYGMAGRMRAVEQQLQHRAATSNAAQRATDGHKAEVSAVQDHLQRLMGEGGATAAEANRRNAVNDAFQSVQRLSSQLLVTPVPPPRPPEGSWAAQEEARRSAASSGARRIGARGNYDESAGPSVTAPGVRSGARTARF